MPKAPTAAGLSQKQDAERRAVIAEMESDPLDFCTFNPAQHRLFDAIRIPRPHALTVIYLRKGNGTGGTFGTVAAWSALMFGTENPHFQGSPWGVEWPFRKSARIVSQGDLLGDKGPIQAAMRELFPVAQYKQTRGVGKPYYSEGETDTGWDWDVKTYDQTPQQCAGGNKGLIIFSEPPPYDVFTECCTRLRGNGLVIIEMTPLGFADWAEEMVDSGGLVLNGKRVGDVRIVAGTPDDACVDCNPPDPDEPLKPHGHRRHTEIEADIALWPWEEQEARRTGQPLSFSGRILPNWGPANLLEKLPDWHQKCWDQGLVRVSCTTNPHDRLPWPIGWAGTWPNGDFIWFAEWPPFEFHKCKSSPVSHFDDYRNIIIEAEAQMPRIWRRVMDPLFGEALEHNGFNLFAEMRGPCLKCKPSGPSRETAKESEAERLDGRCPHSLDFDHGKAYPGSVNAGHIILKAVIGDPAKNIRPKMFTLKNACPNINYALSHYAYKDSKDKTKGASTTPQLVHKVVTDVVRLALMSHLNEYPEEQGALDLYRPPARGSGTTSIG